MIPAANDDDQLAWIFLTRSYVVSKVPILANEWLAKYSFLPTRFTGSTPISSKKNHRPFTAMPFQSDLESKLPEMPETSELAPSGAAKISKSRASPKAEML